MDKFRFSLLYAYYIYCFISLLFLSSCTVPPSNGEFKDNELTLDSSTSVLLITSDTEIGKALVDEFEQLKIRVVYLEK